MSNPVDIGIGGHLWRVCHSGIFQATLVHSAWLSLRSLCNKYRRWFRPLLEKKRRALRRPSYQDWCRTDLQYASLIGSTILAGSKVKRDELYRDGPQSLFVNLHLLLGLLSIASNGVAYCLLVTLWGRLCPQNLPYFRWYIALLPLSLNRCLFQPSGIDWYW